MYRLLLAGALLAAAGVAFGAFGAHALKAHLDPAMLDIWQTAVHYHLIHALGMIALGFGARHGQGPPLITAGWLLGAGIVLFSGSLYLLAASGMPWLGAITPFGGLAFIAGWLLLAWRAWRMESGAQG